MAEFLIKARNATNSDPVKDARACYKIGDIVVVEEDGFVWGLEERLPRFVQVKVTGVTKEQALKFIAPDLEDAVVGVPGRRYRRRRLFRMVISELPVGVRNTLSTVGRYETTKAAVQNFVENKLTLARGMD